MNRMRIKVLAVLLMGIMVAVFQIGSVHAQGRKGRILALVSQSAKPYQDALAGFREHLVKTGIPIEVEAVQLEGDASRAAKTVERAKQEGFDLILALGSVAAAGAVGKAGDVPVVVGLVLDANEVKGRDNVTGVTLDIPADAILQSIGRVLPGLKKVGVLHSPGRSQGRVESATTVARTMSFTLVPEKVEKPTDIPIALESLAKKVEVLWGLHDDIVYSPQTAKQILLFCVQNKIPFIGLSDAWVKAGALFSVDADYREMGAQCAEMAGSILKGQKASTIPVAGPRKLTYSLNLKTAQHLKLDVPTSVVQGACEVYK
jgi:putative tryptophan/tyrosine transport system substrate-binding protein